MKYRIVEYKNGNCFVEKKKSFFKGWECVNKCLNYALAKEALKMEIKHDKADIIERIHDIEMGEQK